MICMQLALRGNRTSNDWKTKKTFKLTENKRLTIEFLVIIGNYVKNKKI